jgi:uncharacterized RDD family membrane protein YckC
MTTSPGWYKDPAEPTTQRYWDGEGWVGESLPLDATPPDGPLSRRVMAPPLPPAEIQAVPSPIGPPTTPPLSQAGPLLFRAAARPHGFVLAGMGARLVARIIDFGVLLLLNVIVNGWFVYQWALEYFPYTRALMQAYMDNKSVLDVPRPSRMDNLIIVISLLAMALWFAYEVPATAHSGQTLGKRAARIKVIRVESTEPLGFLRAVRRWNPMGLPLLLLYCCGPFLVILQLLDLVFIPIDRVHRMALHDRSAGTFVVQLPGAPGRKG